MKKEPALAALEGNLAGSRPKELFEDALEAADAQFEKDRAVLKKAIKEAEVAVEANTTFDAFNGALEAAEEVKGIIKPNRWERGSHGHRKPMLISPSKSTPILSLQNSCIPTAQKISKRILMWSILLQGTLYI